MEEGFGFRCFVCLLEGALQCGALTVPIWVSQRCWISGFPIVFAKGFGAHGCEVQGSDTKGLSFKSLGVYPKP